MVNWFDVRPLSENLPFGVEIIGLRPQDIGDAQIQDALRQHWIKHGVLVFRNLEGERVHLDLSRVFGPLIGHPIQTQDLTRREIFTVRHDPGDAYIVEVDGEVLSAWLPWHSDLVHVDRINHGGILRPLVLPAQKGETGFIDKIASYDSLPQDLKRKIDDLYVLYQFDRNPVHQKFGRTADVKLIRETSQALEWKTRSFPRVLHPMVCTQAETGRKLLNVSPWFALGIEGMPGAEGDALLHEVMTYAVNPKHAYFHRWRLGEMVLWDNWRVLHSAAGCSPLDQRWFERTTIEGDYGLGRVESRQAIDENMRVEV
jgi:taurine dioxygenase